VGAPRTRTVVASGASMYPCIPSGSALTVREYAGEPLHPGDVVGFVSGSGMLAHRVLETRGEPPRQRLQVRGDAQRHAEELDAESVAYVVLEVAHRGVRYRMDGPLGRLAARLAMGGGLPLTATRRVLQAVRKFWPR